MKKLKRYVVTISYYEYAETEAEARKMALELVKELNDNGDCNAEVESIVEKPFGCKASPIFEQETELDVDGFGNCYSDADPGL